MTTWDKTLTDLLKNQGSNDKKQLEKAFATLLKREEPNQLIRLLGNPTVDELKQLCKSNHVKGYSNLKKDEIVKLFETSIVTKTYFNTEIDKMDEDQKRLFLQTLNFNVVGEPIESDVTFPKSYLIFETERDTQGKHLLWIPQEIIERVEKWVKQHKELMQLKQQQDLIEAATNLYGLYSFSQLQHLCNQYLEKQYSLLDIRKLLNRLGRLMPETINFRVGDGFITSLGLEIEPNEYAYFLKDAKYYEPDTLQELLYYQTHVFGIDELTYFNFVSWLAKNIREDNQFNVTGEQLSVEILTMMKHAVEYEMVIDVIYSLIQDGILRKRVEQTAQNKVKPVYMKMRNWVYHGYTFEEYMALKEQEECHKQTNVIDFNQYKK